MSRREMLTELAMLQNDIEHVDILTITAYMDDEQVARHLDYYRAKAR